jgi:hypothetical protein
VDKRQKKQVRFSVVYVIVAILGMWLFQSLIFRPFIVNQSEVSYSQFRQDPKASGRTRTTSCPSRTPT